MNQVTIEDLVKQLDEANERIEQLEKPTNESMNNEQMIESLNIAINQLNCINRSASKAFIEPVYSYCGVEARACLITLKKHIEEIARDKS